MRQVASALLLPVLLTGVTACQSGASSPAEQTSRTDADETVPDGKGGAGSRSRSAVAQIGDTTELGGGTFGERLQISVRGLVDPAISRRATIGPLTGKRWLGIDISLANVGGKPYDTPVRNSWVVDEKGSRYPAIRTGEITTGSPLVLNRLPVGEQVEGWLVFEVPENARIVQLHCTVGTTVRTWQI
ncbi:DUF4352 domain-containing protein [Streptomyces sp. NBC_01142]|uniref:DUF4352 domain-containing protein n=1 Tax=Streptomyces sp. NBC_01142 TaxID=2975865 RepID=UPI00225664A9|nr:DUF4352 domain-containing protein [Streptomyces sp. NBC_01142]MCX4819052.1 DUF4352 domain-containing protein [Streptomyces sp. NBC_01142]